MYTFSVNGVEQKTDEDQNLLYYLRNELNLTAAKDGCSQGVCGTCTIIIDGKKVKACTQRTSKLEGKKITTLEGIDKDEMRVYEYAFAECGAVQCGFCIPGMVISAKVLIDENKNPTPEDVKKAIRGNLCRCTGYKKIEEAILLAAKMLRENIPVPEEKHELHMDERAERIDAKEKVNGTGLFADDIKIDGMLYGGLLFSKYPRALIKKIDISKAEKHPDCIRILLKKDVPDNLIGHVKSDWDVMMGEGDITKYVGNVLAEVISEREDKLSEILSLIDVEYEELRPITNPFDALKGDAPLIHPDGNIMSRAILQRGNADEAIKNSKYVVTRKYKTSWQDHAFMEPECAIAEPEYENGVHIWASGQSVYDVRRECAKMLRLPLEKVHVEAPLVGGGFGGKEDMSVQQYAALAAWHLKRPVKVKYSRDDSLKYHVKRHPMEMEFTTACDENGKLTAMKGIIIADTGAYASLGGPVLHRACTHAAGPYNYQNVDILGMSVYTNNVVSGAFRGFGVTQSCFATEMNINLLAEMCGLDPWEIRKRNAIKPGDILPNGQKADPNTNMEACIDAVKDIFYSEKNAGIACGFKNSGTGMGKKDIGRVLLSIDQGRIHIRTSAACMGQGIGQMCLTEICDVTGLDPALFFFERSDTVRTPDSGTSTASRQTVMTGEAARRAGEKLKEALKRVNGDIKKLEGEEFLGEFSAITDPLGAIKENPISHISYSYGCQVMLLDENGMVKKAVSAFDVGNPVNIQSVEGQIEGGMVMGIGYAASEKFECVDGYPKTKLGTLGLLRSDNSPELEVILCKPDKKDLLPYSLGAKGCGELCMIPTAPALALAYYRRDGKFRQELPLRETPYRKD